MMLLDPSEPDRSSIDPFALQIVRAGLMLDRLETLAAEVGDVDPDLATQVDDQRERVFAELIRLAPNGGRA
jgi:hypothetical protein